MKQLVLPCLASLVLASGCTSLPRASEFEGATVPRLPADFTPVSDGRARFRQVFCQRLAAGGAGVEAGTDCDALLWRLKDEPPAGDAASSPGIAPGAYRVLVVTGAFGDCRWKDMVPFGPAIERLVAQGVRVDPVVVGGRSGAEHNARQIAEAVARLESDRGEPIVMVGYSKGAVDILQFLVSYPEQARRVAAVVSIGGPILGSPLARQAGWWFDRLPKDAFSSFCDPGDGGIFASLVPEERISWMQAHPLPGHVRYLSVAGFTTREHLSRGLRLPWRELAAEDHRNDGQVIARDALIPGSTLLALVNADHWDLAIALEEQVPYFSSRPSARQFPRDVLFESVLAYVSEVMADGAARPPEAERP